MADIATSAPSLGPITESRFLEVFEKGALATAKDAAALLNLDVGTLAEMTEKGFVRAVPRGRLPAYTEADLRAFLSETQYARREPEQIRKEPVRAGKVVPFTQRRRR